MLLKEPVEIPSLWRLFYSLYTVFLISAFLRRQRLGLNLFHAPILQPQYSMAPPRECQVLSCNEGGDLMFAVQSADQPDDPFRRLRVQVSSSLSCQQQFRTA